MNEKFTPPKWMADGMGYICQPARSQEIAGICMEGISDDEFEGNIRLIAKAPEMYYTLSSTMNAIKTGVSRGYMLMIAQEIDKLLLEINPDIHKASSEAQEHNMKDLISPLQINRSTGTENFPCVLEWLSEALSRAQESNATVRLFAKSVEDENNE